MTPSADTHRRILVIDDDTDILESIAIVLQGAGYETQVESNGAEALERIRVGKPCLVLLDLMMPGMNGWQFRAEQLSDSSLAAIPTIVMTGFPSAEKASSLGAVAFLKKPIDLDELLDTVARFC